MDEKNKKCCEGCNHYLKEEEAENEYFYYCEYGCEPIDGWCVAKDTGKNEN